MKGFVPPCYDVTIPSNLLYPPSYSASAVYIQYWQYLLYFLLWSQLATVFNGKITKNEEHQQYLFSNVMRERRLRSPLSTPSSPESVFLGTKKRLYKRLRRLVGPSVRPSVHWSVCPHDAITWKTSYVAIASRRGGGRGKLVTSLFLRA
jgi:hypothetical protein